MNNIRIETTKETIISKTGRWVEISWSQANLKRTG